MKKLTFAIINIALAISAAAQNPVNEDNEIFDFDKYKDAMYEMATPRFAKSEEPVRFIEYALIDIDSDGISEVWVRGDEGQDWQGVFSVIGDSVVLLADADVTSEIKFYKNAVGYSGYISPGVVDMGVSVLKGSRIVSSAYMHYEFNIFSDEQEMYDEDYIVNDKYTDKESFDEYERSLGETITIEPVWQSVRSEK